MGESVRPGVCYIRGRVLDLVCVIYGGECYTWCVLYMEECLDLVCVIYGGEC